MDSIPHGTPSAYSWHKCRCEVCVDAKRAVDRAYYERNREAVKAKVSAYRDANIDLIREQQRLYRQEHAEEIAERKRVYHQANKERISAYIAAWKKANPDKVRDASARDRAKHREQRRMTSLAYYYSRMASDPERMRRMQREWSKTTKGVLANRAARHRRRGVPYTDEAKAWIATLVDPVCFYCGRIATEIDHVVPVSKGGTGERSNLVPACRRCNSRKGSKSQAEFLRTR